MSGPDAPVGREVYARALRGDVAELDRTITSLARAAHDVDRVWALALDELARHTFGRAPALAGATGSPVVKQWLRSISHIPHRDQRGSCEHEALARPLWLIARQAVFGAVLRFDRIAIEAWVSALSTLDTANGLGAAVLALARGWSAVFAGVEPNERELASIRCVVQRDDADLVTEASVVRALGALDRDDLDTALALVRRASRAAASEGALGQEYLANLVLARVRRRRHASHLALRIIRALEQVVPATWHPWLAWERSLAGDVTGGPLADAVAAFERGDAPTGTAALALARADVTGFAGLAREVDAFRELVDVDAEPTEARTHAWVAGADVATPFGIRDAGDDPLCVAYVAAIPGRPARRVSPTGVRAVVALPGARTLRASARARRTHEALAVLALAGSAGLSPVALFEATYGFAFDPSAHDDVLRGLVHRMRIELEDGASIAREETRLVFVAHAPITFPDPRCERTLADRALTLLAARGGRATAKELAHALSVPLRSVQRALGELVEEGACVAEPDGRRTEYVVEDTTFQEPTLHRMRVPPQR